jgi:Protein of unknown function (DUF3551)
MRNCLVIAAVTAIALGVAVPSYARHAHHLIAAASPLDSGIQDRWCLQGTGYGYPGNCEYSTYEQCRATASGQDAGCGINPLKAFAQQRRGYN